MNASVARTFRVGERINMDFRIDATNVLNRVTFNNVYTQINGSEFGLRNSTNNMRRLHPRALQVLGQEDDDAKK